MRINEYNSCMTIKDKFDEIFSDHGIDLASLPRSEINTLMLDIDEDIQYLMKAYAPPKLIRHHHELLSKLIKHYGH